MFLPSHCGVLHTILTYISLGAKFRKCGSHTELKKFHFSKHEKKIIKKSFGIFGSLVETTQGVKVGEQILPLADGLGIVNANTCLLYPELSTIMKEGIFTCCS